MPWVMACDSEPVYIPEAGFYECFTQYVVVEIPDDFSQTSEGSLSGMTWEDKQELSSLTLLLLVTAFCMNLLIRFILNMRPGRE